ncbi:YraN family protein [uncultured Roseobacter sp.]|uniref:YraN family protein n=1 Tax=uncultured Roseobacter sp. TaxID=114847 RepID=UPI00262CA85B|nr:YraN family protein [uncultured Roseobacter sp.]
MPAAVAENAKGRTRYEAGLSAEDAVARVYQKRGWDVVAKRWRGKAGEIDLILRRNGVLVFAEVKKSRSFDTAALRINAAQMCRIMSAAQEFAAREPDGLLSDMRFDAALVDSRGGVRIIPNAFGAD